MDPPPLEVSCTDVKRALDEGAGDWVLVDCREAEELAIVSLPAARALPMSELPSRVEELAPAREQTIVVLCHHGMRSAQTAAWLRTQGFAKAVSMAGGIDRWAEEIDPSLPRY